MEKLKYAGFVLLIVVVLGVIGLYIQHSVLNNMDSDALLKEIEARDDYGYGYYEILDYIFEHHTMDEICEYLFEYNDAYAWDIVEYAKEQHQDYFIDQILSDADVFESLFFYFSDIIEQQ